MSSGSVTASVSPNFGFKVESLESGSQFTGSINVSGSITSLKLITTEISGSDISGSFQGDGSRLTGLIVPPQVATKIVSGSVTASVSPVDGFVVFSISGSRFTGSLFVSGNIVIPTGSGFFSGSGAGLTNIPRSALTPDALLSTEIKSGSVTASVSPEFGFRVESLESGSQFTGSLFISGAGVFLNSGSFSGSGKNLFDIPISALSNLDTSKIFSGSATASISPNRGFEVFARTSNFSGSISASVFSGSGAGLTDIPFSALSQELFRIASGSVTASASPNFGFRVTSFQSGSDFSGSIRIDSSSFIYSEGTYLRNIPRNALTEEALISTEIKSGSVTASVSPNFGFRVISAESGSQFTGSLFVTGGYIRVETGSFFSGSGAGLSDIPESALSFKINRIASGSVTASISPDYGLRVNTFSTISGSFIVSSSIREIPNYDLDTIFNVTNAESSVYNISNRLVSGSNPTLTLVRNVNYTFNVNASGHPFWIKTVNSTGTGNAYTTWVTNNGDDVGTINFLVSGSAPDTLYYNCQLHGGMAGTINVVDALYVPAEIKLIGDTKVIGVVTASVFSGSGKGLFDIPQAALSGDAFRIASGSVTASVSPNLGFRVQSFESGSDFSGSIRIDSSSFIYSLGTYLREHS
jgi:hypothetical protein